MIRCGNCGSILEGDDLNAVCKKCYPNPTQTMGDYPRDKNGNIYPDVIDDEGKRKSIT
jgi:hypothetical protein